MSNRSPTTRIVNIPAQFLPKIEEERERLGCFSIHECMGHILTKFFGTDALNKHDQDNPGEVIKGVKLDG